MAHSPPYPDSYRDTGDDREVEPALGSTAGAPRWVKVLGIMALVLVLPVVVLLLTGGGTHGPGRHMSSSDVGGQTPPRA